jgi:hypothetical protein
MRDLLPHLEHAALDDGMSSTAIPFAHVNRRRVARGAVAHVLQPSVWIYVAGHKRARVGRQARDLSAGDVLTLACPTTVVSEIVSAPYLCVMLTVDASLIASLAVSPREAASNIADPLARLVRLLDTPTEIPVASRRTSAGSSNSRTATGSKGLMTTQTLRALLHSRPCLTCWPSSARRSSRK